MIGAGGGGETKSTALLGSGRNVVRFYLFSSAKKRKEKEREAFHLEACSLRGKKKNNRALLLHPLWLKRKKRGRALWRGFEKEAEGRGKKEESASVFGRVFEEKKKEKSESLGCLSFAV